MSSSSSSSGGTTAVKDDVDSTKDDTASDAIAIRHRGGFSLSTSTFMPIFFIIQLYAFLKVGFGGMAGV